MARTRAAPAGEGGRGERRQRAALGIEGELQQLVIAQRSGVGEAVVDRRAHCVRLGRRGLLPARRLRAAVGGERIQRDHAAAIGGAEQPAPGRIHRDVRHALRERRFTERREPALARIDGEGEHAPGLVANGGVEHAPIRPQRQRHHRAAAGHALAQRQRAARLVEREHRDLAAVGVADVDDASAHGLTSAGDSAAISRSPARRSPASAPRSARRRRARWSSSPRPPRSRRWCSRRTASCPPAAYSGRARS